MRRATTVTLAICIGVCFTEGRLPAASGAPAGLKWTPEQGGVRLTPRKGGVSYLVVTTKFAKGQLAAAPSPSASVSASQQTGSLSVGASRRTVAYALVPVLACDDANCAPCRASTPSQPDCSVPPVPPPFIEQLTFLSSTPRR